MSSTLGRSVPRREGPAKVTGHARYVDDVAMPGMLYGVTVRSPIARGVLRGITYGDSIPWQEFTIVTAGDISAATSESWSPVGAAAGGEKKLWLPGDR